MANSDIEKPTAFEDTSSAMGTAGAAGTTRREFMGKAVAAASVASLAGVLPAGSATPPPPACEGAGDPLEMFIVSRKPPEAGQTNGLLKSILQMSNEVRTIPTGPGTCGTPVNLRCFKVLDSSGKVVWPAQAGVPRPGPIFSAEVGDTVEITFLNHVNENEIFGSVDFGDPEKVAAKDPITGKTIMVPKHPQWGCDTAKQSGVNTVPFADDYPDCFHGSNAANMHFHGTHVTPEAFGDNVLVQIEPDLGVSLAETTAPFAEIFGKVRKGSYSHGPVNWTAAIPDGWQKTQDARLANYDNTHQFQGKTLKAWGLSLLKTNEDALKNHEWPPYQMGAFPYAFTLTKYEQNNPDGPEMGQAPGTHWYHAHKHGSTTMHLLHGLAGAFLIKGLYDVELQGAYQKNLAEKVLVIQEFASTPTLYASNAGSQIPGRQLLVNGQLQPAIAIAKGEIQMWRIVNAAMQAPQTVTFPAGVVAVRQIAQDGVQFRAANYKNLSGQTAFVMSPGNRIDVLVQGVANGAVTVGNNNATLVSVKVDGQKSMSFPDPNAYPISDLKYLDDIDPASVRCWRRLTFGWEKGRTGTGKNPNPPHFLIDGKQFEEGIIYQSMTLGAAEEWHIENATSIVHPFHIHVNPFQVFEVMNPNTKVNGAAVIQPADYPLFQNPTLANKPQRDALIAKCKVDLQGPFIWWDTLAINQGLTDSTRALVLNSAGECALPGYFKMRSRFVDFPGKFVLHCHILGHEDRGMMQLVEVSTRHTAAKHH